MYKYIYVCFIGDAYATSLVKYSGKQLVRHREVKLVVAKMDVLFNCF